MSRLARARCPLLAGLFFLVAAGQAAAVQPMVFQHLTAENGLPQNSVMTTLQDSQGFIWLGTEAGLGRFDGYEVTVYTRDRRIPDGLASNYVWSIAEDRNGDLWIVARDGGVACWHRRTDRFSSIRHDPADPQSLSSDATRQLLIDSRGSVWIGTTGGGLNVLEPATGHIEHYRNDPARADSLSSDVITALHESRDGQIWVGTDAGLNRWLPNSKSFQRFVRNPNDPRSLSSNKISTIATDRAGALWIGTVGGGLNRLDRDPHGFTVYRHDPGQADSLSSDEIRAVLEDSDGRIWVGTENGLDLLDRSTERFVTFRHDPTDPATLRDDRIASLYQDSGGLLWVGTRAGGVSRWNPRSWSFGHQKPDWLKSEYVNAFAEDSAGRIWIGTLEGLTRFDPQSGEHVSIDALTGRRPSLADARVMSLLTDRDGSLWIGTMSGGLGRLGADGKLMTFRADPVDPHSLSVDGVMSLHQDGAGRIWIGTFGGGVNILDPASGRMQRIPYDPRKPGSLSSPRATAIVEDAKSQMWIGTDGGGLNLLSPQGEIIRVFKHDPRDTTSLSANTVYALHVDNRGRIWVGTDGGGLDLMLGSSAAPGSIRFQNISKENGLASDVIYSVLSDDAGLLWLSSNAGLMRYDPQLRRVKSFHRDQGLQDEEFNFGARFRARDGRLLFGGPNGFNRFAPDALDEIVAPPRIALTRVEVLNRPARTDVPYALLQSLDLGYRENVVSFEIAALDFTAPLKNRYSYRLHGFDDHWVDLGTRRRISYTNLDAGHYTLEVQAASADGVPSRAPLRLSLNVRPAPWFSVWAYALYASALAGAILFLLQTQKRKLRAAAEAKQRLEREVAARTAELSERNAELDRVSRAKGDFLARMSHEIRTPMNGVIGMTDLLMRSGLSPSQAQVAATVSGSARSLLQILNDILDLSKVEAGKLTLEQLPFDLREVLEESAALLAVQAEAKGLELVVSPPPEAASWLIGDALRIRQVILNLVGNAIKFTPAGEVSLKATFRERTGTHAVVDIAVRDTGIGMSQETVERVFEAFAQADETTTRRFGGTGLGLAICRQIVDLMGGEIRVDSEPELGSTFFVTFTLPTAVAAAGISRDALKGLRAEVRSRSRALQEAVVRQVRAWGMEAGDAIRSPALRRAADFATASSVDVQIVDADNLTDELPALTERRQSQQSSALVLLASSTTVATSQGLASFAGATAIVTKPFRCDSLYQAIVAALRRASGEADAAASASSDAHVVASAGTRSSDTLRLQGHALVVEDNPVNCIVTSGLLTELGCTVTTVGGGREAVARAAAQRFDVILMDLQMPGMDGTAATALIRKSENGAHRTPIVALTANEARSHRQLCLDAGMDDFLGKPFTLAELALVLGRWLPSVPAGASGVPSDTDPVRDNPDPDDLDRSAIARIRSLDRPGHKGILPRVLPIFVTTTERQLGEIRAALVRGDLEAIRAIAHALKSSAGNVGASQLARLARELEQACIGKDLMRAQWLTEDIIRAHPRVIEALQQEAQRESA